MPSGSDDNNHNSMADKILVRQVDFLRSSRRVDGSISMTQETPKEATNEDFAEIDRFTRSSGIMIYRIGEVVSVAEMKGLKALAEKTKLAKEGASFSERLRAVIFIRWKESRDPNKGGADEYYAMRMDQLINDEKGFLPPPEHGRPRN